VESRNHPRCRAIVNASGLDAQDHFRGAAKMIDYLNAADALRRHTKRGRETRLPSHSRWGAVVPRTRATSFPTNHGSLSITVGAFSWSHENGRHRFRCLPSGLSASDHFVGSTKMVPLGSGSRREIEDVSLTLYACYILFQNADGSKPEIAALQSYFAVRTAPRRLRARLERTGPFRVLNAEGSRLRFHPSARQMRIGRWPGDPAFQMRAAVAMS